MEERLILTAILLAAAIGCLVFRMRRTRDSGRFAASALVAALTGAALHWDEATALTVAAVLAFAAFVVLPQVAARVALSASRLSHLGTALLPLLWWGRGGRAIRDAAIAQLFASRGELSEATRMLDAWSAEPLPPHARAAVGSARATVAMHLRSWEAVVSIADDVAPAADPVQLLAARAAAELGRPAEAFRRAGRAVCASPGTWDAVSLAAAELAACATAGDLEHVDRALSRPEGRRLEAALPGSGAYWRGRCLLTTGDETGAKVALTAALERMPAGNTRARETVSRTLDGTLQHGRALSLAGYEHARDRFDELLGRMLPWVRFIGGRGAVPVTWVLIAVSALALAPLYTGHEELWGELLERYANVGSRVIADGEHWRLVTALFLHANLFHLGFNALALLLFGGPVERLWGPLRMVAVFLVTGLLGHLTSALWHGADSRAVGASTGVYGVIAVYIAALLQLPGRELRRFRLRRATLLLTVVGFDVLFSLVEPRIDTAGHVGGFAAGAVLSSLVYAIQRITKSTPPRGGTSPLDPNVPSNADATGR